MTSSIDFYHVSLKLFLKNEKGEILVMQTLIEGNGQGKYDVPGGRIDEDEFNVPFEQIIRREVAEELGDTITSDILPDPVALGRKKFPFAQKDASILFVFFEGMYRGGEIKICEEYSGFDWIDPTNPEYADRFIPGIYDALQHYLARGHCEPHTLLSEKKLPKA